MFEPDSLEAALDALDALGALLADRGLVHELVAFGGGSLLLLRLIDRPTKDLDLVAVVIDGAYVSADPLPSTLVEAAQDVARLFGLPADWLNNGSTPQLKAGLPPGFEQRVHSRRLGGLVLHLA